MKYDKCGTEIVIFDQMKGRLLDAKDEMGNASTPSPGP